MNRANLHSVSHSCAWPCFHSAAQGEDKRLWGSLAFTAYSDCVETWDLLKSWREGIQSGSFCVCIRRKMARTQHDLCPGKAHANYHFTSETWEIFKTGFLTRQRATSGPAGSQPMFAKWFVFPQLNNSLGNILNCAQHVDLSSRSLSGKFQFQEPNLYKVFSLCYLSVCVFTLPSSWWQYCTSELSARSPWRRQVQSLHTLLHWGCLVRRVVLAVLWLPLGPWNSEKASPPVWKKEFTVWR